MKNPKFKPDYSKLSTFAGYIFFNDITQAQKDLYKEIKREKRARSFKTDKEKDDEAENKKEVTWIQNVYKMVMQGKLTSETLLQLCLVSNKKYSSIASILNKMIKDQGLENTLTYYLNPNKKEETITTDKKEELANLLY